MNSSVSGLEVCSGAGDTGTPRAPRGLRGDGFGAYGVSVVSGTELHRATTGRGYAAKGRGSVVGSEREGGETPSPVLTSNWKLCLSLNRSRCVSDQTSVI